MAFVEENWQTKQSTITERMSFILNTEILSDVKFVAPVSTGESESKKVIPAHKFVLAISSPVFFDMFYGQMAETTDSIELPDCEYESLLELFRYLYSNKVKLRGSNVMQVLYLANKYMVSSLASECNKYLRYNLKASNVFCILPLAEKIEDKDLEDRCWKVIDKQTEEALMSDEFVTLERSLVESVVKRENLRVKEVELFKAVDCWATNESERQGITPDGDAKRRIVGEEIVKAIRFPLMSEKEFASLVINSHLLTLAEVDDLIKHFSDISVPSLLFSDAPRIQRLQRLKTFIRFAPDPVTDPLLSKFWDKDPLVVGISFSVNKPIMLHGVQHFGSETCGHLVFTNVRDTIDNVVIVNKLRLYSSEKDDTYGYYGFDVKLMFDRPAYLRENRTYSLSSSYNSPNSEYEWRGKGVQKFVECQGVQFTFYQTVDQFPVFIFSLGFTS